jgi:hypothetical protein
MADKLFTERARTSERRLRPSPSIGVALLALFVAPADRRTPRGR